MTRAQRIARTNARLRLGFARGLARLGRRTEARQMMIRANALFATLTSHRRRTAANGRTVDA